MKEKFVKFLKDHRAYTTFKRQVSARNANTSPYTFEEHLKKVPAKDYILSAFTWSTSKEGSKYWTRLNKEWQEEVK